MNSTLTLRLLGPPAFSIEGKELPCVSRKALWMSAYVLLGKTEQTRVRLAELFWGGTSTQRSLGSLRVALTKLPEPVLACLDVRRDAIGPAPGASYRMDVDEFLAHCGQSDVDGLQRAVSIYAGDLFEGVDGEDAPAFSDWLFTERNRIRQLAHEAHVALAERLHTMSRVDAAREVAEAWLKRDPTNEAMHRLLIGWLAQSSGNDRAYAYFEVYRRALAVTQGAAPSPAMAALGERLRHAGEAWRDVRQSVAPATAFFGREAEIKTLRGLLADPACRLLTLHGMGGVGKTRLAIALTEHEAASFGDGTFVVALEGLASPDLFAQSVSQACGLQAAGTAQPLDLVISFLKRRHALLVLDNLEHLFSINGDTPIAAQIAELVGGTGPDLKVLVTSREPLRLQEEWVFDVQGLAYPRDALSNMQQDAPRAATEAQDSPAVQFFFQRARQAHPRFSLQGELRDVARICATLEGLPLGLELAASWMGTVPCAEMEADLRARAATLGNRHSNRVERHHSLGAVIGYSWSRLDAGQREALSRLAVLVGNFSGATARQVASASPDTLGMLADKALVMRLPNGRWHMHEVVRQFAWEQCGASHATQTTMSQAALRDRRDAHFMEWLAATGVRLEGGGEPAALRDIDMESANLREAWLSSASSGKLAVIEAAAPTWFDYLECRSFIAEGVSAAKVWLQAARRAPDSGAAAHPLYYLGLFQRFSARNAEALATLDHAIAALPETALHPLSQARAAKAFAALLLGDLAGAEREARAALELAEPSGDPGLQASACRVLGLVLLQSGRREEGRELERRALELASRTARPSRLAAAHNNLAMAENHLGNYGAAEQGYESALRLWREIDATANIGRGLHNLGVVATRLGDHALALTRYRAALDVLRKAGDRNLIALNLMSTGDALLRLGRPEEARGPALQALRMAERDGHMLPALDARIVLAQASTELGSYADAARHLAIVLESAGERRFANVLADAIVSGARLFAAALPNLKQEAQGWAQEICAFEQVSATIRKDAELLVQGLGSEAGGGAGEPAVQEQRDIDALAVRVSERLGVISRDT